MQVLIHHIWLIPYIKSGQGLLQTKRLPLNVRFSDVRVTCKILGLQYARNLCWMFYECN